MCVCIYIYICIYMCVYIKMGVIYFPSQNFLDPVFNLFYLERFGTGSFLNDTILEFNCTLKKKA